MKPLLAAAVVMVAMHTTESRGAVVSDSFSGATLGAMWEVHDSAASYAPGGGFSMGGTAARFDSIYNTGYGSLQTDIDTSGTVRVDAVIRNDNYYTVSWAPGVVVYYDVSNWVAIKLGGADGFNDGWQAVSMIDGVATATTLQASSAAFRFDWHVGGVELTETSINFYGSELPIASSGSNADLDPATLNTENALLHTIARPAGFVGSARLIIGQGYSGPGMDPFFENSATPDMSAFVGIDGVRIETNPIPEPVSGVLLMVGYAVITRRIRSATA